MNQWPLPDGAKHRLSSMGRMFARGEIDRAMIEYLISVGVRPCPPTQRGDAVDRMLEIVAHGAQTEENDRESAITEVSLVVKPLIVRERPVAEIREAAIAANKKWLRDHSEWGVLREDELVRVVKEEMLTHRQFQGRRKWRG